MANTVLKYVDRLDTLEAGRTIEARIFDDIANPNNPQNVLIAGFPGVGKSCIARAIAAAYTSRYGPAVILSVQNKNESGRSKIALVNIDGLSTNGVLRVVPIPVVSISASSINSEEVVNQIVESLQSLEKDLKKVKGLLDSTSNITKIKEGLEKLLGHDLIPTEHSDIITLSRDIIGALPYVQAAIGITLSIISYFRERRKRKRLDKLRKENLLVVVDDLKDLGNNWQILSDVLADSFRYAFVTRIEDIDEYLKLVEDRTYSNRYLHEKNYPVFIRRLEIVPPPSKSTFDNILHNYESRIEDIERLWSISGGIPAIALMILEENPTLTSRDLEIIRQEISNLITNKEEIYWSESDYRKRLAMALYATMQMFQKLISRNKAYGLLCVSLGVTQDDILIFCGCQSENGFIYIPSEETVTRERITKIITTKNCCPEERKMTIQAPPVGGTNCCIGRLNKSIVQDYAICPNENDLSDRANKYSEASRRFSSKPLTREQGEIFYKFTGSFEHMPSLLKIVEEIEKSGSDISPVFEPISIDLNQIRKTLECVRNCLS